MWCHTDKVQLPNSLGGFSCVNRIGFQNHPKAAQGFITTRQINCNGILCNWVYMLRLSGGQIWPYFSHAFIGQSQFAASSLKSVGGSYGPLRRTWTVKSFQRGVWLLQTVTLFAFTAALSVAEFTSWSPWKKVMERWVLVSSCKPQLMGGDGIELCQGKFGIRHWVTLLYLTCSQRLLQAAQGSGWISVCGCI